MGKRSAYETELKKVVRHPAVQNTLSSLEQQIMESYGPTGKDGNFDKFKADDVDPMAEKLTNIVEDNLLDELNGKLNQASNFSSN
ncbi:hypothetical protein OF83DRAFT_1120472 [Amylostereum chailletii]|nr:hypothetical protein OF83DRAFT_1120472 [Amylostereum chailletii]